MKKLRDERDREREMGSLIRGGSSVARYSTTVGEIRAYSHGNPTILIISIAQECRDVCQ
jgi:hypothetical protein